MASNSKMAGQDRPTQSDNAFVVRSVREQVNWAEVRSRTAHSPYARAFFALLDELELVKPESVPQRHGAHVRVVSG